MTKHERLIELEDLIASRDRNRNKVSILGEKKKSWTRSAHYPSSLRACKRQLVQDWLGEAEQPLDFFAEITFAIGHAFEEVVVKEFKDLDFYKGDEEKFTLQDKRLNYPFVGRIDLLVNLDENIDPDRLLRPVELKTISNGQFEDTKWGGYGGNPPVVYPGAKTEPKFYHVDQLTVYLKRMNLDWGILIYLNKDNSDYRVFKIYYDHERYEKIVEYCRDVEEAVEHARETGELPKGTSFGDNEEIMEINDNVLTVYQKKTKHNDPGDVKLDKQNKSAGIVSFPCIWKNSTSGRISTCRFFESCWGDKMKDLGITMQDIQGAHLK